MAVCECGREFKKQIYLDMHRPHCLGARRCQNPKCNKPLLKQYQVKYCSPRCSSAVTTLGRKVSIETRQKISRSQGGLGSSYHELSSCLCCGKILPPKRKYCNTKCQVEKRQNDFVKKWLQDPSSYKEPRYFMKRWLFKQHGEKCHECGWNEIHPDTGKIPVELHHKDGDYTNNCPENLTILCPNCHTLTSTYRIGNRGNGRKWARDYYHKRKNSL